MLGGGRRRHTTRHRAYTELQQNDSQNHHVSPEAQLQNSPCHGMGQEAVTFWLR